MKKTFAVIAAAAAIAVTLVSPASALEYGDIAISGGPVVVPILHGKSSNGDAPKYRELFNTGFGINIEGFFSVRDRLRAGGTFGIYHFPGKEYNDLDVGNWWVAPMMVGLKYFWFPEEGTFVNPYVRLDGGMVYYSAVLVENPYAETDYGLFRTSTAFAGDAGIGFEWNFGSEWMLSFEVKYMLAANPREKGDLNISSPQEAGFLPIRFALVRSF